MVKISLLFYHNKSKRVAPIHGHLGYPHLVTRRMRELIRAPMVAQMERSCFDFPREVFPSHHRSGLKEGYGRFSGWLPGGIFKRLGIQNMPFV